MMMVGVAIHADPLRLIEMPIEVTIEAPPKADPPAVQKVRPLPLFLPPPAAAFNAQSNYAFDMRQIADEERQRKAAPDGTSVDGDGTAKSWTASPSARSEKRDREEPKNDPDKEAYLLLPPPDSQSRQKAKIVPPGEDSKAWAPDEQKETADETTAKREEIKCGANAKRPLRPRGQTLRGQVLRQMTKDQVDRLFQRMQALRDLLVSPDYLDNVGVVFRDEQGVSWSVLVPHGLTVSVGDRIEVAAARLDPSRTCHYIPGLVSRVL